MKRIETVVIGAGQCGLAMSACLLDAGREHIVLERGQVAQAWRDRWDSLTLLSPNWFTRLPRYAYSGDDPNGFIGRDDIVQFFADYAAMLKAPVECGFDVAGVTPADGSNRIIVRGTDGQTFDADNVVVAIGGYHTAKVPSVSAQLPRTVFQVQRGRRSTRASWRASIGTLKKVGCASIRRTLGSRAAMSAGARTSPRLISRRPGSVPLCGRRASAVSSTGFGVPRSRRAATPSTFVASVLNPVCSSWVFGGSTLGVRISSTVRAPTQRM